jgi:Tol biopolymer transport system component
VPSGVSPDGKGLLLEEGMGDLPAGIGLLDLATGVRTTILSDPEWVIYRARFSPDGGWIVFHAGDKETAGDRSAKAFIAPFRGARAIPAGEWISVTEARSDASAWSPDGQVLYFASDSDGSRCIWARRLDLKTKKPIGEPFAVVHLHEPQQDLKKLPRHFVDVSVGADKLLYAQPEGSASLFHGPMPVEKAMK